MDSTEKETQRSGETTDRAEITDVIHRYAQGLHDGSTEVLVSCFAEDAVLEYGHGEPIVGHAAIRAYFDATAGTKSVGPSTFDRKLLSTPLVGNVQTRIDGDTAHSEHMILAMHVGARGDDAVVIMRSTRNVDELVRTKAGWKIAHRRHWSEWHFETPGTFVLQPDH